MTEALSKKTADVEGLVETGRDSMNRGLGNSAVCTTAADTAAKGVTMGSTFELIEGAMVLVEFQNAITVSNATLAVTHTPLGASQPTVEAAKPIYYNGAALGANIVPAGAVVMMRYNGTAFKIVGIVGSNGGGSEAAYTPTLQNAPTSSTLTYTKDGQTVAFEIGQFCRVPDATMDTGYKFYQLYDIKNNAAVWQEMGVLYSRLVLSVGSNQAAARTAALRSSAIITVKNSENTTIFSGTVEQAMALKLETSETYTISASDVSGYTTPQSQTVTTSIGSLDSVEMVYNTTELTVVKAVNADGDVSDVASGTVAVYDLTDPEEPVEIPAGADGKYLIPIGTPIKVSFGSVKGYNTPEDQTATYTSASENAQATITGTYTCVAYTVNVTTNQSTHTDIAATVVRVTFGNEHTDLTGAQTNTIVRVPVGTTPTAAVQSGTPTGYDSVVEVDSTNHTISALFRTEVVTIALAANVNQAGMLAEKPNVTVVSTERGTIYNDDYEGAITLKVKPTDTCTVSVEAATNFATPSQESFTAGTTGSRSITMTYLATLVSLNMVGEDAGVEGNFPTGAKGTVSYNGGTDQELSDNSSTAQVPQGTAFSVNYTNVNGYVTPSDYSGTATGNSMTVTKATYVKIQDGQVTTVPTAKSVTYTGSSQQLINAGAGTGTMMYKLDDGSWSSSIPEATNAGTYTVYYKALASTYYYESAVGSVEVTLAKATPTYTAPTAKTITYNGSAQDLLNAGSSNDGTIKYSSDNENWSTSIPQSTNDSDSITVYWKLEGDSNHTDVASTSVSCSIAKAAPTYTAPTAKSGLVYTGSAQDLLNAGSTSDGTIQYSSDNENWDTIVPSGTNAGDFVVYWKLIGDSNHTDISSTSITCSIAKADRVVSITGKETSIEISDTNTLTINVSDGSTPVVSSSNTNIATINGLTIMAIRPGSATITISIAANSNYNAYSYSYSLSVLQYDGIYAVTTEGTEVLYANIDTSNPSKYVGVSVKHSSPNMHFFIDKRFPISTTASTSVCNCKPWANPLRSQTISYMTAISGDEGIGTALRNTANSAYNNGQTGTYLTTQVCADSRMSSVSAADSGFIYARSINNPVTNAKNGYLGSVAEWFVVIDNITMINNIMNAIGGVELVRDVTRSVLADDIDENQIYVFFLTANVAEPDSKSWYVAITNLWGWTEQQPVCVKANSNNGEERRCVRTFFPL